MDSDAMFMREHLPASLINAGDIATGTQVSFVLAEGQRGKGGQQKWQARSLSQPNETMYFFLCIKVLFKKP